MTQPGTITGREAFMNNIARRLGRSKPLAEAPPHPVRGVPEHYRDIKLTPDENVGLFAKSWSALTGKVLIVKEAEAKEAIAAYLRELKTELALSRAAAWEHEELAALGIEHALREAGVDYVPWRELSAAEAAALQPQAANAAEAAVDEAMPSAAKAAASPGAAAAIAEEAEQRPSNWAKRSPLLRAAERSQLGIVWADWAIANTGTLALLARGGKGRSVSLLPGALLAIFRQDQLVTRMGEVFARIKEQYPDLGDLPSSINLITGPSRSADIENDLTIGIHGPGKVHAIIIVP
ncbi:MAG: lactate utilization protein [Paenibacillaceae bacterium]|nr:lactate utilization protein [Paenibacillaceae bacterium]